MSGTGNHFQASNAKKNTGVQWAIGAGNVDDIGNTTNGATFSFTGSG